MAKSKYFIPKTDDRYYERMRYTGETLDETKRRLEDNRKKHEEENKD